MARTCVAFLVPLHVELSKSVYSFFSFYLLGVDTRGSCLELSALELSELVHEFAARFCKNSFGDVCSQ